MRSKRLELVGCCHERKLRKLGDALGHELRKFRLGIEPGSHGRAALGKRIELSYGGVEPSAPMLDRRGIA